jgi:hypothetical protein
LSLRGQLRRLLRPDTMTRRMTPAEEYELAQLGVGPYDPEAEPPEPSDLELLEQWFTEVDTDEQQSL